MGVLIAISILLAWGIHLIVALTFIQPSPTNPFLYLAIAVQTFLFTGLFITAHDAIHHSTSKNKSINKVIGYLSAFLYACFFYRRLKKAHWEHHKHPGTALDPDYHPYSNRFWPWYLLFMWRYLTWYQILGMALLFNLWTLFFNPLKVALFWALPAILSTFQLFYFGTYATHRRPHTPEMAPFQSRSLHLKPFAAFLACYFFSYHWEHHQWPDQPWWRLNKLRKFHCLEKTKSEKPLPKIPSPRHPHRQGWH